MKIKQSLANLFLGMSALCLLVTSCTSDSDKVLEKIPADVMMVMKADVVKGFEEAGFKFTSDAVETPEYLKSTRLNPDQEMLDGMAKLHKGLDMKNLYFFTSDQKEFAAVAEITDRAALQSFFDEEKMDKKEEDGMEIYERFVVDGNTLWMVDGPNPVSVVKGIKDRAAKDPIAKYTAVTEKLAGDGLVTFAYNYNKAFEVSKTRVGAKDLELPEELAGAWGVGRMFTKNNSLVIEGGMMKADGGNIELPGIGEINSSVLNYVPEGYNLVMAMGKPDAGYTEKSLEGMKTALSSNFTAVTIISALEPYLKSVDGSCILAAGALSDSFYSSPDFNNWGALLMVHMPQDKINEAVTSIENQLMAMGLTPDLTGREGLKKLNFQGRDFYYGSVDGYFTISTAEPNNDNSNSLNKYVTGHTFGAVCQVPMLNSINPMLPEWAPMIFITSEGAANMKSQITLEGTSEDFVKAILKFFAR